jgi:hypothetical protein
MHLQLMNKKQPVTIQYRKELISFPTKGDILEGLFVDSISPLNNEEIKNK